MFDVASARGAERREEVGLGKVLAEKLSNGEVQELAKSRKSSRKLFHD